MADCRQSSSDFTPTEQALLRVLADGWPHLRAELKRHLPGSNRTTALQMHISNIRKRLRIQGFDILCELHKGTVHYRQVRLIGKASDG